ncbi:hypothetical protein WMF20_46255 [Sorangium sp. So ce834]|uniref:hypothetical protein n=1 Tax=Sorangium sp. So ce834 TaxID=3133321 RepID=UPI003F6062CC
MNLQHRLLEKILGERRVARPPQEIAKKAGGELFIELAKSGDLAADVPIHRGSLAPSLVAGRQTRFAGRRCSGFSGHQPAFVLAPWPARASSVGSARFCPAFQG